MKASGKIFSKDGYMYAVVGSVDYEEGDTPLALFWGKRDAQAFQDACFAHKREQPVYVEDYDKWLKEHSKWKSKHPAGRHDSVFDGYRIVKVPKMHMNMVLSKC